MGRIVFKDRTLKAWARRPPEREQTYLDSVVPGLGFRVMRSGQCSFVLVARFPGSRNPTRRSLGVYGALTLQDARAKARAWHSLIKRGIDPEIAEKEERVANIRRQANTFGAVVEDYVRQVAVGPDPEDPEKPLPEHSHRKPLQRKGYEVARDLRRTFVPLWGDRLIPSITRADVLAAIEGVRDVGTERMLEAHGVKPSQAASKRHKSRATPTQARNALGYLKTLLSWAIDRGVYGLEISPCAEMRAERIVGAKKKRGRILSDDELRAFWRATGRMGYPTGSVYRLLLLSGLRLNEAADASTPEMDREAWTIPAERMKGENGAARAHVIPLTKDIIELFESLPRFENGAFLFSTTFGASPVWMGAKVKARLDRRMLRTLKALARRRGEDPRKVELRHWVNHDLRRTLRTGLSALRIDREVREAVVAHAKPGLEGTYDLYDLFDEKKHALQAWAGRLRSMIEPRPVNVVALHKA